MRDGSVDKTYKPLSGKVTLGRWLKWKLCTNIYTSLMGRSRICRAVWGRVFRWHAPGPRAATPPSQHPAVSAIPEPSQNGETAEFGSVLWRGGNKKEHLESPRKIREMEGWNIKSEFFEFYSARGKVKDVEFLNCVKEAAGGDLSAADRQVLRRLLTQIRFISPPGGFIRRLDFPS